METLIHSLQTNMVKKQMKYNLKIVEPTIMNQLTISYA